MLKNLTTNKSALLIFKALDNKARFVGGCVRDSILNKPVTDIDIATPHLPEAVMEKLRLHEIKVIPTGLKHGTVTAIIGDMGFEITTLRKDVDCDGRHAEVEFTDDWEADAARRDFTMNAMSAGIDGKIYDYFGGEHDLKHGLVRFVGDARQRCREDILRILRFFRFNAYYGNGIFDGEAQAACLEFASKITTLSGERIQTEMLKLLSAPKPQNSLYKMDELGILKHILPTNINMIALDKFIELEARLVLRVSPLLRLAVMLDSGIISSDDLEDVLGLWKLSNKQMRYLELVMLSPFEFSIDIVEQNKFIRVLGREIFRDIILVKWAEDVALRDDDSGEFYQAAIANANAFEIPVFPVSGEDLKAIGIEQGRALGKALRLGEEWWEASGYNATKAEVLKYIKQISFSG
jgi:poly(A) polymerase